MRHWLRSYYLLLAWTALRKRSYLPLNLIVQSGLAVGIVVGFSFLIPHTSSFSAIFLGAGAPVLGLVTIGMVIAPQEIAQAKLEGHFEFNRSLPVPRSAILAADATVSMAIALPGLVIGPLVAAYYFGLHVRITVWTVPIFMMLALTALAIGYMTSYYLAPAVTGLVSQAIVFIALMFSPINFPASRLPSWLSHVNAVLPFEYMGEFSRHILFGTSITGSVVAFSVLAAWAISGLIITLRVMIRRD